MAASRSDLMVPEKIVNEVNKQANAMLGRSGDREWDSRPMRTAFNQVTGAQICRCCGALNTQEATSCSVCHMAYEVAIFVGVRPEPVQEATEPSSDVPLTELGSVLAPPVEIKP